MNANFLLSVPAPMQGGEFEFLAGLLDALNTPVSYSDREMKYRYANAALARHYNVPREAFIGHTLADIQGEKIFSTFEPIFKRVLAGEQISHEGEIDGDTLSLNWWQVDHYPNRDASGKVIGYFTFGRDITENKRLERELAQREAQLRQLVDSIKLPIACWDRERHIVYCNTPYVHWTDKTQEELYGKTLTQIFGATAWTLARASFERAFAGQAATYERQVKQPDGSLRWHRIQVFPDTVANQTVERIFTIAFDIEDDIRMRQQLAASEARLRSVVETINQPIIRLDRNMLVTYANKAFAAYTNRTVDEIVGHSLTALFGAAAEASVSDHYKRAFSGETVQFEQHAQLKDVRHWLRIQIVPDRDAAGNVHGVFATAYDVDAEIRANKRLEEARKRLDHFADSIPFPLTYLDRDGLYRFANRIFLERHSLTSENVIKHHPREARGERVWQEYKPYFEAALAGAEIVYEREVTLASGDCRWTRTIYSPDRNEAGEVIGVYTASSDIHEIKSAQMEIARVNTQLQVHLNRSPVAVVEYDASWAVTQWSRRAEEMLGSSKEEMLGKSVGIGRVHPDDRVEVADIMRKIRSAEIDTIINTNRYQHADGRYVWIEWYTSVAKDELGNLQSVLSLGVDSTARVTAEQRLQRFANRTPNPVTYLGPDSRYQFMNIAYEQWSGVSAKQMIGKTPVEVRGLELGEYFQGFIDRALQGEELHIERLATLANGQQRWVNNHYVPDRDESGKIVGCYNVTFDIHHAKLAEQALKRAADRDSLTQALSRSAFFHVLDERLSNADDSHVTLMFIDLDGFKGVNDSLGHAEGDALLIDIVANMRAQLGERDELARLGGDEFVVLAESKNRKAAESLATRVLDAVSQVKPQRSPTTRISASIGIAMASRHVGVVNGETLVREADQAMYVAKRAGGGQIRFFE
jgi:diguanylate cyclase (GGDEF)-like protein/PAS domain S-box-containing protein